MIVGRDAVSDRFRAAIASNQYTIAAVARVLDPVGNVLQELQVTGGSVEQDTTADVRTRVEGLTVLDEDLVPVTAADALAPYGNQLQVARGVEYPDGTQELVSLGYFRLDETDADDNGVDLSLEITGEDRSAIVSDAKFEDAYQVDNGTLFTDAILDLVQYAIPDVQTNFSATSITTPLLVASQGDDRWVFAQGLAEAIGAELFFDGDGILVLRPVPSPADVATKYLVEGEGGVLVQVGKNWSRVDSKNKWIVAGENSDNISTMPTGYAVDDNPNSPTYYGGPFGKVPEFVSSEFVTTDTQAQDMAEGLKAKNLGTTQTSTFTAYVDPTTAAADVVRISRARLGMDENHVIDSLSIPLVDGTMTGQTRAIVVTA